METRYYSVPEVVGILKEKGILKVEGTSGEEQIRRWIRTYKKEEEKHIEYCIKRGYSEEETQRYINRKNISGIKGVRDSRKKGYQIERGELERFIDLRSNSKLFDSYIGDSIKLHDELFKKFLQENPENEFSKTIGFSVGFLHGVLSALDYVEEFNQVKDIPVQEIKIPSQHKWYLKEENIRILNIEEKKFMKMKGLKISFEFIEIPNMTFHTSFLLGEPYGYKITTFILCDRGYSISTHNENRLESLWVESDKKPSEHLSNKKVRENLLVLLDMIQKKTEETDHEQKMAILMLFDSLRGKIIARGNHII